MGHALPYKWENKPNNSHQIVMVPEDNSLYLGHTFSVLGGPYIQLVKVLYCKRAAISKQLLTFPNKVPDLNHRPQR